MLGEKLRDIRKSKNLTLENLSAKVDLSIGYLSQIERGNLNPTMDTLRKISDALDISPYMLMETKNSENFRVKKENRIMMKFPKSTIYYEILSPLPSKEFSPAVLVIKFDMEPHGYDSKEFLAHPSEETVVMLEGEMDIVTEDGSTHLKAGDSLLIPKNCHHRSVNNSDDVHAKGICVLCPLKWPF